MEITAERLSVDLLFGLVFGGPLPSPTCRVASKIERRSVPLEKAAAIAGSPEEARLFPPRRVPAQIFSCTCGFGPLFNRLRAEILPPM
jgi:hypothetical protein